MFRRVIRRRGWRPPFSTRPIFCELEPSETGKGSWKGKGQMPRSSGFQSHRTLRGIVVRVSVIPNASARRCDAYLFIYCFAVQVLVPSSQTPPLRSQALWEFFLTHLSIGWSHTPPPVSHWARDWAASTSAARARPTEPPTRTKAIAKTRIFMGFLRHRPSELEACVVQVQLSSRSWLIRKIMGLLPRQLRIG